MMFPPTPKIHSQFLLSSIKLIVDWTYSPGMRNSALYKEREKKCDYIVESLLNDLTVQFPESEIWDNRRKPNASDKKTATNT